MVWNGTPYFKVDSVTQSAYVAANSHALAYVQDGQERALKSYWAVPASVIEDEKQLCEWARAAYGAAIRSTRDRAQATPDRAAVKEGELGNRHQGDKRR